MSKKRNKKNNKDNVQVLTFNSLDDMLNYIFNNNKETVKDGNKSENDSLTLRGSENNQKRLAQSKSTVTTKQYNKDIDINDNFFESLVRANIIIKEQDKIIAKLQDKVKWLTYLLTE